MPVVALILMLVAVAAGVYGIFRAISAHRTPPELRGDWWSQFEREFHAYASRTARPTHDRRRRQRGETA
jgi:hypothetical protein